MPTNILVVINCNIRLPTLSERQLIFTKPTADGLERAGISVRSLRTDPVAQILSFPEMNRSSGAHDDAIGRDSAADGLIGSSLAA